MNNIYQNLRNLRKNRGLSCEAIAKLLGISKSYYWQIECKKRKLYYSTAIEIAKIFKMRPDELFYDDCN